MRRNKRKTHGLLILVLLATPIVALTMGQSQKSPAPKEAPGPAQTVRRLDEQLLPVVDYAEETPNAADATKRAIKRRYNGRHLKDSPTTPVSIVTSHWLVTLPALPVTISDAVVIGEILKAEAILSEDKKGVYSEFALRVDKVLKDNGRIPVAVSDLLMIEREGGRVRFPSGRTTTLIAEYQGVPLLGHKYLVFLKRGDDNLNTSILTAYEILQGQVFPIDGRPINGGQLLPQFAPYDGAALERFLGEVRTAITKETEQISNK